MIKASPVQSQAYRLVRWGSALCLVFAWASACSGSDNNVTDRDSGGAAGEGSAAAGAPTSSGGSGATPDEAGAAGQALGGAAPGGGGADGGASLGGAPEAGGAGGAGETDVCPNAPTESAGAGCQWKAVLACNSGVQIADWCGDGMVAATLERCESAGGGLYSPDAGYSDFALSPCPTDCPIDAGHVVWRCIECCPVE